MAPGVLTVTSMSLDVAVRKPDARTAVLDLNGRLTLGASSAALRKAVDDLAGEGYKHIVLNVMNVSFVDSAGLGALVVSSNTLKKQEGDLRLLHVHERLKELLDLTGLVKIFPSYDDESSALSIN